LKKGYTSIMTYGQKNLRLWDWLRKAPDFWRTEIESRIHR